MNFRIFKTALLLTLLAVLVLPSFSLGQENLAQICKLEAIEKECDSVSQAKCQQLLEKCDAYYEAENERIGEDITKTEQEKKTLQNQISVLRSRINQFDLQIQQGNVVIKDLGYQIVDTEGSIDQTSLKIEDSREKLAAILRTIYTEEQKSLIEILLSEPNLSDFFNNLMALEALSEKNQELLANIKGLKSDLENQKQSLDSEKRDLEKVVQTQYSLKQQSEAARKEQERLLQMTEAQYQQYLKEKEEAERMAAEIRARLFRLIGIPKAPTFGEAIDIAFAVTKVVSIRPAFLLGVISAESALGRNVGQCYITNSQTGGGVYIQSGNPINRIMHPTRDLPIFLRMTGDNFSQTPVSCWIPICYSAATKTYSNNVSIDKAGNIICPAGFGPFGFGGAMGPAQFIPSTWALYEPKLINLFAISNPNPWSVYDAFAASALYLSELGAGQKTTAAERNAANRYSGGYSWYADDVMRRASCIQDFIDKGAMSATCQQLIF